VDSVSDYKNALIKPIQGAPELNKEEQHKFEKPNAITQTLRRGENVKNRQLQRWLSKDEYNQIEA